MTQEKRFQYEDITQNEELPVNLFLRTVDSKSDGCEFHWHEELEIYYVISGGVCLLCDGKTEWLYPGDVGFVNWCEPHRGYKFLDGTKHYIIQIGTKLFENETIRIQGQGQTEKNNMLAILISRNRDFPLVIRNEKKLTDLLDFLIQEMEAEKPGYEMQVKAAVLNFLTFLLRQAHFSSRISSVHPKDRLSIEHLKKILFFLSEHYTNPEAVSLTALSRQFGLSVPYLCRIFKKHTGLTLANYINELRCSRAASLIKEGLPLIQISEIAGFSDYNYFSRVFKKVMGCTPSRYQKG